MVNQLMDTGSVKSKQRLAIWAITSIVGVTCALPAWDRLVKHRGEVIAYETKLHEISHSVSNLALLRERVDAFETTSEPDESKSGVDLAQRIRESVTQLAQQTGCQIRRLTVGDSIARPWHIDDDPLSLDSPRDQDETGLKLETRSLSLSVGGSLPQLTRLTLAISQLDQRAVPTSMTLERGRDDGHLTLDLAISVFDLADGTH